MQCGEFCHSRVGSEGDEGEGGTINGFYVCVCVCGSAFTVSS